MNKLLLLLFACMGEGFPPQGPQGEITPVPDKKTQGQAGNPDFSSMVFSLGRESDKKSALSQLYNEFQIPEKNVSQTDFSLLGSMMNSLPSNPF
jgi:hypothetical protein